VAVADGPRVRRVVEEVGAEVRTIRPGEFVVGSFFASDNTCELCRAGYQSSCLNSEPVGAEGTQAEYARIPLADGTLVATPEPPPDLEHAAAGYRAMDERRAIKVLLRIARPGPRALERAADDLARRLT
jgi:threonine dehydrogenase-like Zn-dependent dehydrogenase